MRHKVVIMINTHNFIINVKWQWLHINCLIYYTGIFYILYITQAKKIIWFKTNVFYFMPQVLRMLNNQFNKSIYVK